MLELKLQKLTLTMIFLWQTELASDPASSSAAGHLQGRGFDSRAAAATGASQADLVSGLILATVIRNYRF